MRLLTVFLLFVFCSLGCKVKQLTNLEIISPQKNNYWGYQVLTLENDTIGIDTSYYNDLSLQPFVDPVHFNKNKKPLPDLYFKDSLRASFQWIKTLEYQKLKRLNRKSRRSKCVCYEYRITLPTKSISVYVPEDTTCFPSSICQELDLLNRLFIYEKDTSYQVLYSQ